LAIEAMIFDFGNVLIGWDPDVLYRKLIADPNERRRFLDGVCNHAWNHQQDLGRGFAEAIAEKVALFPHYEDHIRAYHGRFPEMLTGPVAEGHAILDRLVEEDFPCYGLTNWSGETYRMAQDQMPFLRHMKYTAVSGDLKMGKPEPEIFRHLLDVIGKEAAATAFIDDSPKNIDAAKKLGINGVLFKNDGSATEELRRLGLPV
jgi:FMN phosphatase YigB (HAD superfamily)